MGDRGPLEASLAAWRQAERALLEAADGDRRAMTLEVDRQRAEYHRLASQVMAEMRAVEDEVETPADPAPANPAPATLLFTVATTATAEAPMLGSSRTTDGDTRDLAAS